MARAGGIKQRSVGTSLDPTNEFILSTRETNDRSFPRQEVAIHGINKRASSRGDDQTVIAIGQLAAKGSLVASESGFSILGEDIGNRLPSNDSDLFVHVDELAGELFGNHSADRRFSYAHESCEY